MINSIERLKRNETRIITQGTAGTPDPPLPPPPAVPGPIFIMASFHVFDVTNPALPSQIGVVTVPAIGLGPLLGNGLLKNGNTVWTGDNGSNFSAVDVTTPAAPAVLDQLLAMNPFGGSTGIAVDGTVVYYTVGGNGGGSSFLNVINGADPSNLSLTITYNLDSAFAVTQRFPRAIVSHPTSHRIYIINAESGLNTRFAVYNATTPAVLVQQGTLNLVVAPAFSQACDLAINFPLVYALLTGNGTSVAAVLKIIDVSNPAAPTVLSTTTIGGVTDLYKKLNIRSTTLYIGGSTLNDSIGAPSKILTYDVSNSAAPSLSATLTLTGISRPLTALFVRSPIAYVGSAGDSEAQGLLSTWNLSTGFLFEGGFIPTSTLGVLIDGAP